MTTNGTSAAASEGLTRKTTWKAAGSRYALPCLALLTLMGGLAEYYRIFSGYREYDDEGGMMMSVRQFIMGHALYARVASPYGPMYHLYEWALRAITRTPVSHDVTRFTSDVHWVLAGLLLSWFAYRVTGSIAIAAITHFVLIAKVLTFIGNEPGHPQELCLLLVAILLNASWYAGNERYRTAALLVTGFAAAALAMTKINIGVFIVLTVSLALLQGLSPAWARWAGRALGVGAVLLPAALMRAHLAAGDTAAVRYAAIATLSILIAVAILMSEPDDFVPVPRDIFLVACAFAASIAGIVLVTFLAGTPPGLIFRALILDPARFSGVWGAPLRMYRYGAPAGALLSAGLAVYSRMSRAAPTRLAVIALAKLAVGGLAILTFASGHTLFGCVSYSWLVMVPPPASRDHPLARRTLALAGPLLSLYAFPVAGGQVLFACTPLVVISAVCLHDGLIWVKESTRFRSPAMARSAAGLVLICVAAAYAVEAKRNHDAWLALTPLELPGAERIRVVARTAATNREVSAWAANHCDTLFSMPGVFSFNFWSGVNPPTDLNVDAWVNVFTNSQQTEVARGLARFSRPCVIYAPVLAKFWMPDRSLKDVPLANYIFANYRTVQTVGEYEVMVHR